MEKSEIARRAPARVPVLLTENNHIRRFFTALVGLDSIFIVTRSPGPPQRYVMLTLTLPGGELFETRGVVTRTVTIIEARDVGTSPGMEIRLTEQSPTSQERWKEIVRQAHELIQAGHLPLGWETLDTAGVGDSDQHQMSEARPNAATNLYYIVPSTLEKLQELSEALSNQQGIFIRTADIQQVGTQAIVCVIHPVNGDEFQLVGEVIATRENGVDLRFHKLGEQMSEHLNRFIVLGIPEDRSEFERAETGDAWLDNVITRVSCRTTPIDDERTIELETTDLEYDDESSISLEIDSLQADIDPALELSFESTFGPASGEELYPSREPSADDSSASKKGSES